MRILTRALLIWLENTKRAIVSEHLPCISNLGNAGKLTCPLLGCQSDFREFYVKCDIQRSFNIVILKVGHTLARLTDLGSRPGHLLSDDLDLQQDKTLL